MNDDLQLHYGKYWADEMNLPDEEIVEQIKRIKREIRRLKVKSLLHFRSQVYRDLLIGEYFELGWFQGMLKSLRGEPLPENSRGMAIELAERIWGVFDDDIEE